jgi:hypothetical protein
MFDLALEEMDGRWVAHVPALFGCFAAAPTPAAAIAEAPRAIADYWAWVAVWRQKMGGVIAEASFLPGDPAAVFTGQPPSESAPVQVAETHAARFLEDDTEINAFFQSDRAPLSSVEVNIARQLLWWSREDLLNSLLGLAPAAYHEALPGHAWTINTVLQHIGTGENWYLDRLGLASETAWDLPDVLGRLILVRQHLLEALPSWIDELGALELNGEVWSPRKVIRRALWHEREHIQQLLAMRQTLAAHNSP